MAESQIEAEYRRAKKEHRQPRCPYCRAPLEIGQTQSIDLAWRWNKARKDYDRQGVDGDADKPYCLACGAADWDFIDGDLVA